MLNTSDGKPKGESKISVEFKRAARWEQLARCAYRRTALAAAAQLTSASWAICQKPLEVGLT